MHSIKKTEKCEQFLTTEDSIADKIFGMKPRDNCSSSRIWLKDHVGNLSPARPVMKKRQRVRGTQVPSCESPLILAKEPADRNKREAATEAELCNLTLPGPQLEELCLFPFLKFAFSYSICHH